MYYDLRNILSKSCGSIQGADWLVDGAVGIARALRISQIVVGATIVSLGTTLPEAWFHPLLLIKEEAKSSEQPWAVSCLTRLLSCGIAVLIKPPLLTSKEPFFKQEP